MDQYSETLTLATPAQTDHLARQIAQVARAGDCLLLRGQIGAGKTTFARAFIRALTGPETEVPSPTFTLVQTYECDRFDIWHADLYRLTDPHDAVELGLTDAFDANITLIEWPELLAALAPVSALDVHLVVTPDAHIATLTYDKRWQNRLSDLNTNA